MRLARIGNTQAETAEADMFLGSRARVVVIFATAIGVMLIALTLGLIIGSNSPVGLLIARAAAVIIPPVAWIWPWLDWVQPSLPAPEASLTDLAMNIPFILFVVLVGISTILIKKATDGLSYIREAVKASRVARLLGGGPHNQQSVGPINAGGDVTVKQIAEVTRRKMDDWDKNFWRAPIGGLALSIAAIIIAALITNLTGLSH